VQVAFTILLRVPAPEWPIMEPGVEAADPVLRLLENVNLRSYPVETVINASKLKTMMDMIL
jgi:hypothetical protein